MLRRPLFCLVATALAAMIERKPRSEWAAIAEPDEIRTSALWRKFISFEAWADGAP